MDALPAAFDKDETIVRNRLKPKDAATLVLVRREPEGWRVLMGRRHGSMAFMANKTVFPGGRVDPCDYRLATGGNYRADVAATLTRASRDTSHARALGLAAIREAFEETGILVGEASHERPRTRSAWSRFIAHGVSPSLAPLEFIARAITPPNRPRRFDARFFMATASAIAKQLDATHSNELLTPCWLTFAEARALDLPSITRYVLGEAEARLQHGADAARPVPFFRVIRGESQLDYV
jgi:8-oxo-dGTP pyrophosphatase MutT (NUDIX family)